MGRCFADTRTCFGVYNSLEQTLEFLNSEISFIKSLSDGLLSNKSASELKAMASQMRDVLQKCSASLKHLQNENEKLQERSSALLQRQHLAEQKQQSYESAVNQFHEQCRRNQTLMKSLHETVNTDGPESDADSMLPKDGIKDEELATSELNE